MEQHIESLTQSQRRQGVEVVSVFNFGTATKPFVQVMPGLNLRAIRPAALRDAVFYGAAATKVELPVDNKINVLHVHGDYSAFIAARILAHRIRAKLTISSVHGALTAPDVRYKFAMKQCGLVFATGYKEVIYLTNVLRRGVYHLPSAPSEHFFEPHGGGQSSDVIAVGNLLPVKKMELLIACAARRPHLRFSVIGDGPQRHTIEALIEKLGCANVKIHGNASPTAVAAAMQASKVFINVSASEGTPTAALEAMASSLPVVLTPSNDYTWLVENGQNGYVTQNWDVDEIVSCLDACLAAEGKRRSMGQTNLEKAQKHRWSCKAGFMTECILNAIASDGR